MDDVYDFDRGEWRADPTRRNQWRFWNGREWTDLVSNSGIRSVDPAGAPGVDDPVAPPPTRRFAPARWSRRSEDRPRFWDFLEGYEVVGASTLLVGGILMVAGSFVQVATLHDRFGRTVDVPFRDVDESLLFVVTGAILVVLGLVLMRSWRTRTVAWLALLLAVWALADAIVLRIDPPAKAVHGVPWNSAINLELVAAIVCIVGCLLRLRADGPLFADRTYGPRR